ncbi:DUF2889 domain-containing protein [Thalassospiraceae bacterium LMO-JJ14]|nr:DUF2889 domain-containing protein [Thalassospiraceae bacterium LMO-JJ14]
MPLSKASPRKHMHTREIRCDAYQRDDGLWDVEGVITDTKSYSFENQDRDGVAAGEAVHQMRVRLTIDDEMVVHAAEAVTDAAPFNMCGDIAPDYEKLVGLKIGRGWRKNVVARLGRTHGCTHISDLVLGPLPVTAYQAVIPARRERGDDVGDSIRPATLDTCHTLAATSPIVKRRWPKFYVGDEDEASPDA